MVLQPPFHVSLAALAFCLCAFGVWGILDREAGESRTPLLSWARAFVAVAGGIAAAVFAFSLFFSLLGQWIS